MKLTTKNMEKMFKKIEIDQYLLSGTLKEPFFIDRVKTIVEAFKQDEPPHWGVVGEDGKEVV